MERILILANSSSGVYDFRRELIQALMQKGYEVSTSNPDTDKTAELEQIGCNVITTEMDRRGINPIHDFRLIVRYRKLIKNEKPYLVITYTIKPNIYGGLVCRLLRIPYAANITGLGSAFENDGFVKRLVTFLYKVALKRAKVVFFENSTNRQLFVDSGIVQEYKTKGLNGAGVNLEHFQYVEYPPDGDGFIFLFVGRLMKEKGVDELFSAMKKLLADGIKCSLMVLGRYEEGYEEKVKQYQKDGWLEYYGYQSDVRPFIAKAHCFVLPSYHEGMANTNLECAASGRPVITSDIPGCQEAIIDGESGFLCVARDEESLYRTMRKMCGLIRTEREQMGINGRKHMANVFDKRIVVSETISSLVR